MPTNIPKKALKDKGGVPAASRSILHEEAHPALTYSLVAIGAFFAGIIILGAISVRAETGSPSNASSQLNELAIELGLLRQRVDAIEEGRGEEPTSEKNLIADCEMIERALPRIDAVPDIPTSVACYEAPDINRPNKEFLSVTALYPYLDAENETKEIIVHVYDFGNDRNAASDFLAKSAYLPVDRNDVKREDAFLNDLVGSFTYEGLPSDAGYVRGANWFIVNDRFGVLVHGTPVGFTDRRALDEITKTVNTDALMDIR